jgi:hypothetical protein
MTKFSFAKAPVIKPVRRRRSAPKQPEVDILGLLANIIEPWAFSYTEADLTQLTSDQQQKVRLSRVEAMRKATECQRVCELHRPKKTVVFAHKGRRVFRKI